MGDHVCLVSSMCSSICISVPPANVYIYVCMGCARIGPSVASCRCRRNPFLNGVSCRNTFPFTWSCWSEFTSSGVLCEVSWGTLRMQRDHMSNKPCFKGLSLREVSLSGGFLNRRSHVRFMPGAPIKQGFCHFGISASECLVNEVLDLKTYFNLI